ncbi:small basic family protein [Candidatus Peregrinibacteria bacterium]|jgi:small basic protein|nr:small basic family protein [Candidatus Peregrinibacteria bacterium]MBT7484186.1 small basic family protein [Candidatus Peregrinibacteria bacterium]MBT7703145.1 small basic family protein [Candidatus Peregrinibacteria bacterium]
MRFAILGLIIGILIGYVLKVDIPIEYTKYTAVVIIGLLDALLGAVRADVSKNDYNSLIFVSGLFFNIVLAVGITYLGDRLGLDLYLAATVVFTYRIFLNVGIIRRALLKKWA